MTAEDTLVVDLGGQSIKLALTGEGWAARLPSGPELTPGEFVNRVRAGSEGWSFRQISIGLPGPVLADRMTLEPHNLGKGWLGYDLAGAFPVPTKVVNDAVMQALGSYTGGKMLFLGLGTGLGSALVIPDAVIALELPHMPYTSEWTYEDCAGARGLERLGRAAWQTVIHDIVGVLKAGMVAEYVVLGGGNAVLVDPLPPTARLGRNENAILGGRRLWETPVRIL